jgi:hypothetical protein
MHRWEQPMQKFVLGGNVYISMSWDPTGFGEHAWWQLRNHYRYRGWLKRVG